MRYILVFFILINAVSWGQAKLISADEMQEILQQESVQLIDVRSLEEFNENFVKGAQNIIYNEDFESNIQELDKSKPVVVYCQTGNRSKDCSSILLENGFKKVMELEDGLDQWIFEGKPTSTKLKDTSPKSAHEEDEK